MDQDTPNCPAGLGEGVTMTEMQNADDNVGSSHDADVDAAYDDAGSTDEPTVAFPDALGGTEDTSHEADVEAGYDD